MYEAPYMYTATFSVHSKDAQAFVEDAKKYNLWADGYCNNVYSFRGEYDNLMKYLQDCFGMSPSEADIEIEKGTPEKAHEWKADEKMDTSPVVENVKNVVRIWTPPYRDQFIQFGPDDVDSKVLEIGRYVEDNKISFVILDKQEAVELAKVILKQEGTLGDVSELVEYAKLSGLQ